MICYLGNVILGFITLNFIEFCLDKGVHFTFKKEHPKNSRELFPNIGITFIINQPKKSEEFYHEYCHYYSNFRVFLSFLLRKLFGNKLLNQVYFLWETLRLRFFH